jgi:hypothetical protein
LIVIGGSWIAAAVLFGQESAKSAENGIFAHFVPFCGCSVSQFALSG